MEEPTDPMQMKAKSGQNEGAKPERGMKKTVSKSPPRMNDRF